MTIPCALDWEVLLFVRWPTHRCTQPLYFPTSLHENSLSSPLLYQDTLETMDEVEEVEVEVFRNIWVRRDIFRSEVGEGEEGPAEPAACAGGGGEETRDHRPQKSREDGDAGEVDRGTRLWLEEKMGMGPMSPNGSSDTEPFLPEGDAGEETGGRCLS